MFHRVCTGSPRALAATVWVPGPGSQWLPPAYLPGSVSGAEAADGGTSEDAAGTAVGTTHGHAPHTPFLGYVPGTCLASRCPGSSQLLHPCFLFCAGSFETVLPGVPRGAVWRVTHWDRWDGASAMSQPLAADLLPGSRPLGRRRASRLGSRLAVGHAGAGLARVHVCSRVSLGEAVLSVPWSVSPDDPVVITLTPAGTRTPAPGPVATSGDVTAPVP